ncbi:unnamed protein product [Rotaria magnacalcarata]|uniref:Integrase catalytic domain-containing protein n=1 Tax=Rotaria magnacalcarata TaxID=392030 RepID=A0A820IBZ2_9BILA|nr:unnamed protein product [Rotaria magnacalcarata]CAF4309618.1 unnamed protein product [Rotaria magnacalcarata]
MAYASSPSSSTDDGNDINTCKLQFYKEISSHTNHSSNNPLFSAERYEQMIELIVNAKLKHPGTSNTQEITCLEAYVVIDFGGKLKLTKKNDQFSDGIIKYFVQLDELFGIMKEAHITIGHRGIVNTLKEVKKRFVNITEKQVTLFISGCEECKRKRSMPKSATKLVIKPVISNDFNARGQVDLVDKQLCPDGLYKFIVTYQDHLTKFCILRPLKTKTACEVVYQLLEIFTIFGAPVILQSDNDREFVAKIIQELVVMWSSVKIVHGRARNPQSQGSVDRCNQDIKQLIGTWIRENQSKKRSHGLRFAQFQKNSCHHRVLQHSPYSVLFGHEPKVGLASISLPASIYDNLITEEELEHELQLPKTDQNTHDQDQNVEQTHENETNDADQQMNDEPVNDDLIETSTVLSKRALRANKNRQDACEGQKRQADNFLQNTAKNQKLDDLNDGDNVLVPVPYVDRGSADARNVFDVIMNVKLEKYQLGTTNGTLFGYYSYNQLFKASESVTLRVEGIPNGGPKSLREIARLQSITGG